MEATGNANVAEPAAAAENVTDHEPNTDAFDVKVKQLQRKEDSHAARRHMGRCTSILILSIFAVTVGGSFQIGFYLGFASHNSKLWIWVKSRYGKFLSRRPLNGQPTDSVMELLNASSDANSTTSPSVQTSSVTVIVPASDKSGSRASEKDVLDWETIRWLSYSFGGLCGAVLAWYLADHCGRKGAMLLSNFVGLIAVIALSTSELVNDFQLLIIGFVAAGFSNGINTALVPIYLHEISPANLRGTVGALHGFAISVGCLVASILWLPQVFGNEYRWPVLLGLPAIPAIIMFAVLPLCPESPMFNVVIAKFEGKAQRDVVKLRLTEDITEDMDLLRNEATSATEERITWFTLFDEQFIWPVCIVVVVSLAQALFEVILSVAALPPSVPENEILDSLLTFGWPLLHLVTVFSVLASVFLVDNPKFERRVLLLIGLCGMIVVLVATFVAYLLREYIGEAASYFTLGCHLLCFLFYGVGPAPIPYFLTSELFETNARASAQSVVATVKAICHLVFFVLFRSIVETSRIAYTSLISATLLTSFAIFVFIYLPDLRGRTPAEVYEEFKLGKSRFARARVLEGDE